VAGFFVLRAPFLPGFSETEKQCWSFCNLRLMRQRLFRGAVSLINNRLTFLLNDSVEQDDSQNQVGNHAGSQVVGNDAGASAKCLKKIDRKWFENV